MEYTLEELRIKYEEYKKNKKRLEKLYTAKQFTIEARILDDTIHDFKINLINYLPAILGEE